MKGVGDLKIMAAVCGGYVVLGWWEGEGWRGSRRTLGLQDSGCVGGRGYEYALRDVVVWV